jgi:arylsulfatase A-like enzyme
MSMDLLPTFARLAGAVLPEGHQFDGVDIMPLVKTTTKRTGRDLHWLFGDASASRTGPWKLIGHDDTPEMLFDLDDDPTEQSNLLPN